MTGMFGTETVKSAAQILSRASASPRRWALFHTLSSRDSSRLSAASREAATVLCARAIATIHMPRMCMRLLQDQLDNRGSLIFTLACPPTLMARRNATCVLMEFRDVG